MIGFHFGSIFLFFFYEHLLLHIRVSLHSFYQIGLLYPSTCVFPPLLCLPRLRCNFAWLSFFFFSSNVGFTICLLVTYCFTQSSHVGDTPTSPPLLLTIALPSAYAQMMQTDTSISSSTVAVIVMPSCH